MIGNKQIRPSGIASTPQKQSGEDAIQKQDRLVKLPNWEVEFEKKFTVKGDGMKDDGGTPTQFVDDIEDFIRSLVREEGSKQYALGQSEGIEYERQKIKAWAESSIYHTKTLMDKLSPGARGYNDCLQDLIEELK